MIQNKKVETLFSRWPIAIVALGIVMTILWVIVLALIPLRFIGA